MTTIIEGSFCKLDVHSQVDLTNHYTRLRVNFQRPELDPFGDFYATVISITDPVDKENYHFTLDEIYAALKETGRLTFQQELSKAEAKLVPMDDFLLSLLNGRNS